MDCRRVTLFSFARFQSLYHPVASHFSVNFFKLTVLTILTNGQGVVSVTLRSPLLHFGPMAAEQQIFS